MLNFRTPFTQRYVKFDRESIMKTRPVQKQPRPNNRRFIGDGMKLHLHIVRVGGKLLRVLTLRPEMDAAFSVNYFHDTWHFISDKAGAQLLAHLLWGLSFQKAERTVLAIYGPQIRPTPFEAEPSPPLLLVPSHLTFLDHQAFRSLKAMLPHLRNHSLRSQTVRWHSFGLELAHQEEDRAVEPGMRWSDTESTLWKKEHMTDCGGFICYTAPPSVLRVQALCLLTMHPWGPIQSDYQYLADQRTRKFSWMEGEVQIFADYRQQLSDATVARREVTEEEGIATRERIWQQKELVTQRRTQKSPVANCDGVSF
jgi:hypothetical protein